MKKLIKQIILFALTLSMLFTVVACGATQDLVAYTDGVEYVVSEKGEVLPYATFSYDLIGGRDVMPIGGFHGPYKSGGSVDGIDFPNFYEEKYIKLLSEAGVNVIVYSSTIAEASMNDVENVLKLGDKYKMGFYLRSNYVDTTVGGRSPLISVIDEQDCYDKMLNLCFGFEYKSLLGIFLCDEIFPNNQAINGIALKNTVDKLGLPIDFYCNSLGYYDGLYTFYGTCPPTTYEEYMNYYMQLGSKMYSSTFYPYMDMYKKYNKTDLTDEETSPSVDIILSKLTQYREIGLQYNLPVWRMMSAGVQFEGRGAESIAHGPDEGEFLFDGNMALAFGCKGIQYFEPIAYPLDQLNEDNISYDFDRNGMLGHNGQKNQWYFYAQKLAKQIQAVDHILMNSAHVGVLAHGGKAEGNAQLIKDKEVYLGNGGWRQLSSVSGDDCYIGCFDYKGGSAYYVVNYSRNNRAETTLKFDNKYRYNVIQRSETADVVGKAITLKLQPGEGTLIVVK